MLSAPRRQVKRRVSEKCNGPMRVSSLPVDFAKSGSLSPCGRSMRSINGCVAGPVEIHFSTRKAARRPHIRHGSNCAAEIRGVGARRALARAPERSLTVSAATG
jgi:hypothetical protein